MVEELASLIPALIGKDMMNHLHSLVACALLVIVPWRFEIVMRFRMHFGTAAVLQSLSWSGKTPYSEKSVVVFLEEVLGALEAMLVGNLMLLAAGRGATQRCAFLEAP